MIKYYDRRTWLHDLDPRIKILWTIALSLLIVFIHDPERLFLLFAIAAFPLAWVRPPIVRLKAFWILALSVVLGTMFSQGFFYHYHPRTPLFTFVSADFPLLGKLTGGIRLYHEGLIYGAVQSLRMLSTLSLGLVLVTTTHPSDLILGLAWLRIPPSLASMATVAIRFLPGFLEEGKRIYTAQQIRGASAGGWKGRMRSFLLMAVPLIVGALRTARQLALAAEVRGFRGDLSGAKRLKFSPRDCWSLALLALVLLAFLVPNLPGEGRSSLIRWGVRWR
ncbi:MAG: energy-coupling factor transporter transmembrane component T [candidate division NC10 bacterium]|nr:energy-coupling factor transporter transmembrane component T [candidate division NC10 bacterium]